MVYQRCNSAVLILVMILVTAVSTGNAVQSEPLLMLGDTAPPLSASNVLHNGLVPAEKAAVTVVVFWASWCPLSRTVLELYNEQQQQLAGKNVCFMAVTSEQPKLIQLFLSQSKWNNLTICCDPERDVFRSFMEACRIRKLPYIFVLNRDSETKQNRLYYHGLAVKQQADDPLADFTTALSTIIDGSYDLAGAVDRERYYETVFQLRADIHEAWKSDDLTRLADLVKQGRSLEIPEGEEDTVISMFNEIGWDLVTSKERTRQHITVGLAAALVAVEAGGRARGYVVDTYARALFENGELKQAVTMQKDAVKLARDEQEANELQATLDWYLAELHKKTSPEEAPAGADGTKDGTKDGGGDADATTEAETPSVSGAAVSLEAGEEEPALWNKHVNAAWGAYETHGGMLVVPSTFSSGDIKQKWDKEIGFLKKRFFSDCPCKTADEVTGEERRSKVLVLYGTPQTNPIIGTILKRYAITLKADGVTVGEKAFPAGGPIIITSLPNPDNPSLPVIIYTAFNETDALHLNSFMHGGNAFQLGQWGPEGHKDTIIEANYILKNDESGALLVNLDLSTYAQGILTRQQALADLDHLHDLLFLNYGGYEDLDWKLKATGSSWQERTGRFKQRVKKRTAWPWTDYFELLKEYLDIVQDSHFYMEGRALQDDRAVMAGASFAKRYNPYFSDIRVRREANSFLITAAPAWLEWCVGKELEKIEVIEDPYLTTPGRPYLFPTLPLPGSVELKNADRKQDIFPENPENARVFLLGMLADPADPPPQMTVRVEDKSVGVGLHRGRVYMQSRSQEAWSLTLPPESPLPVLGVRTMNVRRVGDMPSTADRLRDFPSVVLDLRRNGGGGDGPAMEWCARFSKQFYQWISGSNLTRGERDRLRRWSSWVGSVSTTFGKQFAAPLPQIPYSGRLLVIIDRGIASSGETFTMLSSQVKGAVVLGENTAGCVAYGNCVHHDPLPVSKIHLTFGHTKFVVDVVRHNPEGMGYFPDYWLDVADPVSFITRLVKVQK